MKMEERREKKSKFLIQLSVGMAASKATLAVATVDVPAPSFALCSRLKERARCLVYEYAHI